MDSQRLQHHTMLQPAQKRIKRLTHHSTISVVNLPSDVLENIFSFLPIKQSTSFAILSTRFKNSWHLSRDLIFDKFFSRGRVREDFINIVNGVFELHSRPKLHSFHLYFDPTDVEALVNCWIKKVVIKDVEEIDLDFFQAREAFKLSSDLIDVKSIRVLKLTFCEIHLPPTLNGLCFLRTLILKDVATIPELIDTLFSNCLLLEKLELSGCSRIYHLQVFAQNLKKFKVLRVENCSEIFHVNINAPTICSLCYIGVVRNIYFSSKMPQLNDVIINFSQPKGFEQLSRLREFMMGLTFVKVLSISSTFLEGLSPKFSIDRLREVQFYLWNLKELYLFMGGFSFVNPSDIAFFLKNCPYIERIIIDLSEFCFDGGLYWELHSKESFVHCNPSFQRLHYVKLTGFKFQKLELELVRFFLMNARFLENLVLVKSKNNHPKINSRKAPQIIDTYFHFWRASSKAKIDIFECSNDIISTL